MKARTTTREVIATYSVDDIFIELVIQLPHNYPLGSISVESGRRVGVAVQQWRNWMLQLSTYLTHQVSCAYTFIHIHYLTHQVSCPYTFIHLHYLTHQVRCLHTWMLQTHLNPHTGIICGTKHLFFFLMLHYTLLCTQGTKQ